MFYTTTPPIARGVQGMAFNWIFHELQNALRPMVGDSCCFPICSELSQTSLWFQYGPLVSPAPLEYLVSLIEGYSISRR